MSEMQRRLQDSLRKNIKISCEKERDERKVHLFFTIFQNRIYIILILRKILSLVIYANKVLRTDVQAAKEKYGEHYILL